MFCLLLTMFACSPDSASIQTSAVAPHQFRTGFYALDTDSSGPGLYYERDARYYYLDTLPLIDVRDFEEANPSRSTGEYLISLQLTETGAEKLEIATENNIGKPLILIIENKIIMAPKIKEVIKSNAVLIAGEFSESEMLRIYRQLELAIALKR